MAFRILGTVRPARVLLALAGFLLFAHSHVEGQSSSPASAESAKVVLSADEVDFGMILPGSSIQREVVLENQRRTPLLISEVHSTVAGLTVLLDREIPAEGRATIVLKLDAPDTEGEFEGEVLLETNATDISNIQLIVQGRIGTAFEVLPRRIIAISAYRSDVSNVEKALTLVNRDSLPLEILEVEGPRDRVDLQVKTIEEGQRYQLVAKLQPEAEAGRSEDRIRVRTNKGDVSIVLLTFLKTRVYLAPEEVDLRLIDLADLRARPEIGEYLPVTFHIYRRGSDTFTIELESSLPFLDVTREPAEGPGVVVDIPQEGPTAIFDVTVTPIVDELQPGSFEGVIRIKTNDPEFSELTVPVRGEVR